MARGSHDINRKSKHWCFLIRDFDNEDLERLVCCEWCEYMIVNIDGDNMTGYMFFQNPELVKDVSGYVGAKAFIFKPAMVERLLNAFCECENNIEIGRIEDVVCKGKPVAVSKKGNYLDSQAKKLMDQTHCLECVWNAENQLS